jgi:Predicted nucleic-acid-binding protein containing a Zn-ribbon
MDLAKHWRLKGARYRLEGQRNSATGEYRFPAQDAGQDPNWETVALSGRGEVWSFSVLRQVPSGFEEFAPYPVALIKLEEGPMLTAQLTDCSEEEISIGMPVEMVTRRLSDAGEDGLLVYGYKFRPVIE